MPVSSVCRHTFLSRNNLAFSLSIQSEWTHKWTEILSISTLNDGVELLLHNRDGKKTLKKMFGSSGPTKKILLISVAARRARLAEEMQQLLAKVQQQHA